MKNTLLKSMILALTAAMVSHINLVSRQWVTLQRILSSALDFSMIFALALFVLATTPWLKSKKHLAWIALPWAVLSWVFWSLLWAPVRSIIEFLFANSDFAQYSAYSYRMVNACGFAAIVIALAMPGVWWWKEGAPGSIARYFGLCVHASAAFLIVIAAFSIPPTY